MISEQWFVFVQERIVLPEASTERVWSWELQVDGGQEPFSPTGTDGRGDGGARLEVRGGRLEALAAGGGKAGSRAAQRMQNEVMEAVVWRCSSGGPWRSSGGARREVRGGRLEVLAAGGGKAGSRAAQGMQNGADCTPRGFNRAGLELQVDGGQEPFSPTGTDRGDGGGRLEVLAVRSMAVVWRRSLSSAAQRMQNGETRNCTALQCLNRFCLVSVEVMEAVVWRSVAVVWRCSP
ncbi:unnamed protein product [Boreogadus saida]